jgi:hypothetical protein
MHHELHGKLPTCQADGDPAEDLPVDHRTNAHNLVGCQELCYLTHAVKCNLVLGQLVPEFDTLSAWVHSP